MQFHMNLPCTSPVLPSTPVDNIHDVSVYTDDADDSNDVDYSDDAADIDDQNQQIEFLGGLTVTRVLKQYEHHVARRLWKGEIYDRGPLKVITHAWKLKKSAEVPVPDPVEHWIREFGLMHLSSGYLTVTDVGLISAFVERWYRDISSFHLSFGEMTITLDDLTTLLHISLHGATWEEACAETTTSI
uniref:Protein MAIN-LIKE 1-like n=1 Tax=Cicer arietinum TaxID=3827 RepID=A0A1S2YID9_CICAR|nr:protein MAIN-LIKE 1-like [Cicer arietinum]